MFENKGIFFGKIKDGKIDIYNQEGFAILKSHLEGQDIWLTLEKEMKKRTQRQNRALHVYFQLLADELNGAGLDMREVLKPGVDISWTMETVKEYLWRPIQIVQLKKKSTTDLTTTEIDKVYETLNRFLGQKLKVSVPFPSIEDNPFN